MPRVGYAGNVANLFQDTVCNGAVTLDIRAVDLNVDRRGQSEVQNLRDDIGGQKVEGDAGKLSRQLPAQIANVVRGGMVMLVERYENVGVGRADQARSRRA